MAEYSDVEAICIITFSFCRSIIYLRCCSSNSINPIPSTCVKYGESLEIVADLSGYVYILLFIIDKLFECRTLMKSVEIKTVYDCHIYIKRDNIIIS